MPKDPGASITSGLINSLSGVYDQEDDGSLDAPPVASLVAPDGTIIASGLTGAPYGIPADQWYSAGEAERTSLLGLSEQLKARDYGVGSALTAGGMAGGVQVAAGTQLNTELAAQRALAEQQYLASLGIDAGLYGTLGGAAGFASQYDAETLGAMNQLLGNATASEAAALNAYTGSAADANALDAELYGAYLGGGVEATSADQANLAAFVGQTSAANFEDDRTLAALAAANQDVNQIRGVTYGPDINSRAARSAADPMSILAQYQALGEYGSRTGVEITPQEQLIMEQARLEEESGRTASMNAALADLNVRGMGGSGLEIAAMVNAQAATSGNRMMQDLAALTSAQQRSEAMLEGYSDVAGDIRGQSFDEALDRGSAADDMSEFNRSQSLTTQQWTQEFKRQQEEAEFQRAQDLASARSASTQTEYERGGELFEAGRGVVADRFGRTGTLYDAGTAATQTALARAGDVYGAQTDAVGRSYDRGIGLGQENMDAAQSFYDRQRDVAGFGAELNDTNYQRGAGITDLMGQQAMQRYGWSRDAVGDLFNTSGQVINATTAGAAGIQDATETELGRIEAENAQKALEEEDGPFGIDFSDPLGML